MERPHKQANKPPMAALPAMVFGISYFRFVPFAVWQGAVVVLVASLFIMRAAVTGRRLWGFLAGLATALVIILRHDQGFYLSVAILVYVLALKFAKTDTVDKPHPGKMLVFWVVGAAVIMLPLGVYWLVCGAVPYMFAQLIVFPLTNYAKTSSIPMPVFHLDWSLVNNAMVGMFYMAPVGGGLTAVWLLVRFVRRRFCVKHACVSFILAMSALFYCQVLARSDLHHLLITLPPFFVLCGWLLKVASKMVGKAISRGCNCDRDTSWVSFAATAMVLLVAGVVGGWFLSHTKEVFIGLSRKQVKALNPPVRVVLVDRAGVLLQSPLASSIENVTRMIQGYAEPDESILCLPYQPMFYFLSGRRNPTRWNYIWPGDQTPQDHQTLIEQAQNDPPAVVLIFGKPKMQNYAPTIIDYVDSEYKVVYKDKGLELYIPLDRKR